MRENLTVSGRGQITLPAGMRKRLGIEAGGILPLFMGPFPLSNFY